MGWAKDAQLMRRRTEKDSELGVLAGESCGMSAAGDPTAPNGLDRIDARILRVLQSDGRISNLKLAEAVHLSPTAVLERVRRLTRDGYILGYEARLNPAKLGAGLLVFIEVLLDRTVQDVMDTFKAAVQVRAEILEAHLVAGGFDYLLKTRVADMAAYREFVGNVIWTLPGVRETRTYAVMEEVKHTSLIKV
jgi:Lrp/AsnC family leucine-responsive transcriptional regulator